ncbi:flavodoxin [Philodulcilactobacillus myokoensis]|uniref:Flavodoxin n=1 Tax=Philodulcilactobacillus myokoensis TaxID=2929573 RepID=A0A9W6B272_9LACO|nr:flavodoxin [Philodulcilactobacillus myokoensis]GLB47053.1 flavodoxin [Philodulcilactobacillus myokoensis]
MIRAHVVFATITGNNEDVADIVDEGLEDLGIQVKESEISQTDASDLKDADICVVCAYTYNGGSLPEEGMDFFDDLNQLNLSGKIYGVAGSGDTYYQEYYNVAVDAFDKAFQKANAIKGSANVKINLEPEAKDIKTLDQFSANLVQKYKDLQK